MQKIYLVYITYFDYEGYAKDYSDIAFFTKKQRRNWFKKHQPTSCNVKVKFEAITISEYHNRCKTYYGEPLVYIPNTRKEVLV